MDLIQDDIALHLIIKVICAAQKWPPCAYWSNTYFLFLHNPLYPERYCEQNLFIWIIYISVCLVLYWNDLNDVSNSTLVRSKQRLLDIQIHLSEIGFWMRIFFQKRSSEAQLHTLSILYDVPVVFASPIFRLCIAWFVVAEGLLLLDIGWFVLLFHLIDMTMGGTISFCRSFRGNRPANTE